MHIDPLYYRGVAVVDIMEYPDGNRYWRPVNDLAKSVCYLINGGAIMMIDPAKAPHIAALGIKVEVRDGEPYTVESYKRKKSPVPFRTRGNPTTSS